MDACIRAGELAKSKAAAAKQTKQEQESTAATALATAAAGFAGSGAVEGEMEAASRLAWKAAILSGMTDQQQADAAAIAAAKVGIDAGLSRENAAKAAAELVRKACAQKVKSEHEQKAMTLDAVAAAASFLTQKNAGTASERAADAFALAEKISSALGMSKQEQANAGAIAAAKAGIIEGLPAEDAGVAAGKLVRKEAVQQGKAKQEQNALTLDAIAAAAASLISGIPGGAASERAADASGLAGKIASALGMSKQEQADAGAIAAAKAGVIAGLSAEHAGVAAGKLVRRAAGNEGKSQQEQNALTANAVAAAAAALVHGTAATKSQRAAAAGALAEKIEAALGLGGEQAAAPRAGHQHQGSSGPGLLVWVGLAVLILAGATLVVWLTQTQSRILFRCTRVFSKLPSPDAGGGAQTATVSTSASGTASSTQWTKASTTLSDGEEEGGVVHQAAANEDLESLKDPLLRVEEDPVEYAEEAVEVPAPEAASPPPSRSQSRSQSRASKDSFHSVLPEEEASAPGEQREAEAEKKSKQKEKSGCMPCLCGSKQAKAAATAS